MKPTLVILAAGMGTRYGGLKQIDPVGPSGESIMDYSVFDAIRAGFGKVVFIIRKDIEAAFKEDIGNKFENLIQVEYVYQELNAGLPGGFSVPKDRVKPWGTGHAILMAKDVVDGPFAVINSDDFYGKSAFVSLCNYLSNYQPTTNNQQSSTDVCQYAPTYCMVGFPLKVTLSEFGSVSRGICTHDSENYLTGVVERTEIRKEDDKIFYVDEGNQHLLSGDEIVSTNIWGFTPSIFEYLEKVFEEFLASQGGELKSEFYLPFVVNELIKSDTAKVKILRSSGPWFGVTYKKDKPYLVENIKKLVDQGVYPERLYVK